ncbi:hypothetical protein FOL47_010411, partial [Perkinsus chesapeaki]
MSCSSCCCLPLKGGMVVSVTSVAVVTITNCTIITHFYFHEAIQYIPWLRGEILYWAPLLAWGMSFLAILIGLSALSMPAGGGKLTLCRLYVAALFISAMLWITYGLHFAFRVRSFYAQLLPGNYLIMKSGQAETHQSAKQSAAMVAAAFTNPLVESIASDMLPYPIDVAFYCGPRLHLIIVPFGIIPLIVCMLNLPYAISYANVVEAGGDGTEFCRAEDIPWYLSLSPAEQGVRAHRGIMGDFRIRAWSSPSLASSYARKE